MEFMGIFGGEPVYYDRTTDVLKCKSQHVFFSEIESFVLEGKNRAWVNTETLLVKKSDSYILGCLQDSHDAFMTIHDKAKLIKTGRS